MTRYLLLLLLAVAMCWLPACTGSRERRVLSSSSGQEDMTAASKQTETALPADDIEPPSTETMARAVLSDKFRKAGFRIRYDVPIGRSGRFDLTVDGYDPKTRVGYEYIAANERDTDLGADERLALAEDSEYRILVIDATPLEELGQTADRFLLTISAE